MKLPASAIVGIVLWAAACLWLQPSLLVGLLLIGPFVAVPLVLAMVPPPRPGARWKMAWSALCAVQLPAAAAAAVSFHYEAGVIATAWTIPWLAFASLLGLAALVRLIGHRGLPMGELAIDAGLGFLFVGAFWLAVSRSGQSLLGFGDPIAILTAAHFNLAGIVVPVLAGFATRALPGRLSTLAAFGAVSGLPVVAAGITLHAQGVARINSVAVGYFALAMLLLSAVHARLALRPGPVGARLLWGLSAASLPVGMALAVVYATGEITGYFIGVDAMVRSHAIINVFGFALPALTAWWISQPPAFASAARPAAP